jgi:hypothetical protein
VRVKSKRELTKKRVGSGVYVLPDGRIERTPAAKRRVKDEFLKAGKGCVACDEPFLDYSDVELAHISAKGMNGHKADDAIGNLTLMHKEENCEQGSRSLADYLADPNRIALRRTRGEEETAFLHSGEEPAQA